jgi:hypothetical protein
MLKSLPEAEQERLKRSMMTIVISAMTNGAEGPPLAKIAAMGAMAKDPKFLLATVGSQVEGKTAPEIIALADRLKRDRVEQQLQATRVSIAEGEQELKAKEAALAKSSEVLSSVKVEATRYYWDRSGYVAEPMIAFTVTNNGKAALKNIAFHGRVETPGRAVPWIDETFNHDISGGLEPGETKKLTLAPNRFGPWGNGELADKKDLVLTVRVTNFTQADGLTATETSDEDVVALRERVASLKEGLAKLEAELGESLK